MDVAFLNLVGVDFSGENPAHILQIRGEIFWIGDVLEVVVEQLGIGIADQFAESMIDFEPSAVGETRATPMGACSNAPESVPRFPATLPRLASARDVHIRAEYAADLAFGIAQRYFVRKQRDRFSVRRRLGSSILSLELPLSMV